MGSSKRKNVKLRRSLKRQPCCACGTSGNDFNPVDPAHIRTFKVTQSDHPANVISLCRACHSTQHKDGWGLFLAANPHVGAMLENLGWEFSPSPFQPGKLIMNHPGIV